MQCERLLKLTKTWYLSVKDETMAPARMISFIKNHAASCPVCQADPDLQDEIIKITEIILPESKIPKASRLQSEEEVDEEQDVDVEDEEEEDENEEDNEHDEDDEEDEDDEDDLDFDDEDDDI